MGHSSAPVEYAVAVDRYVRAAGLRPASARVYRLSLASWTWPLLGMPPPPRRRGARLPVVPLALLDDRVAAERLVAAMSERTAVAGARTVRRELSVLRGAVAWWRACGWIATDPTTGLVPPLPRAAAPGTAPNTAPTALSDERVAAVLALPVPLREQVLWHLLRDSAGHVEHVLALDVDHLDPAHTRTRVRAPYPLAWSAATGRLLDWLVAGRRSGPVFLTRRRAPTRTPDTDRCPLTGHGRLSYRRGAELFTAATRPLDPRGTGWTLHQLRPPRPDHRQ